MNHTESDETRYAAALSLLEDSFAAFHKIGQKAYDPGIAKSLAIDNLLGSPRKKFKSIHIAGTNGKGSTAHTLAAIFTAAGYRTGLYTSPHLVDFRERIRIDGEMIPKEAVVRFTDRWKELDCGLNPSFFEITTAMAFDYFASSNVDIAIIETGLGGRFDSTNIITPELSVITNISLDHTRILGDTPAQIAAEKAGIMKPGVPVVIGEAEGEVRELFGRHAAETGSPICFSDTDNILRSYASGEGQRNIYDTSLYGRFEGELTGEWQALNARTVLSAVRIMQEHGWNLIPAAVAEGFGNVGRITGLQGRWMQLSSSPLVIADTGHNPGGWEHLAPRLSAMSAAKHMVIGFVADKDVRTVLAMMRAIPQAEFHITRAGIDRAMPAEELAGYAREAGLNVATVSPTVGEAYKKALAACGESDMVFVGGSTFVVADLLSLLQR